MPRFDGKDPTLLEQLLERTMTPTTGTNKVMQLHHHPCKSTAGQCASTDRFTTKKDTPPLPASQRTVWAPGALSLVRWGKFLNHNDADQRKAMDQRTEQSSSDHNSSGGCGERSVNHIPVPIMRFCIHRNKQHCTLPTT